MFTLDDYLIEINDEKCDVNFCDVSIVAIVTIDENGNVKVVENIVKPIDNVFFLVEVCFSKICTKVYCNALITDNKKFYSIIPTPESLIDNISEVNKWCKVGDNDLYYLTNYIVGVIRSQTSEWIKDYTNNHFNQI